MIILWHLWYCGTFIFYTFLIILKILLHIFKSLSTLWFSCISYCTCLLWGIWLALHDLNPLHEWFFALSYLWRQKCRNNYDARRRLQICCKTDGINFAGTFGFCFVYSAGAQIFLSLFTYVVLSWSGFDYGADNSDSCPRHQNIRGAKASLE
jgi:hypothetical protein